MSAAKTKKAAPAKRKPTRSRPKRAATRGPSDGHATVIERLQRDHDKIAEAADALRKTVVTNEERWALMELIREHVEYEREINVAVPLADWKFVEELDGLTYRVEAMTHDLTNAVYKRSVDRLLAAIASHVDWSAAKLAPAVRSLAPDDALRLAKH